MNPRYAQDYLSENLEGNLAPPEREAMEKLLREDDALAREARNLKAVLATLHALPPREPVLDVWMELSPKVEQVVAEQRLGVADLLRLRGTRFLASFAEGTILWTRALAMNTEARLCKYVLQHPFGAEEA